MYKSQNNKKRELAEHFFSLLQNKTEIENVEFIKIIKIENQIFISFCLVYTSHYWLSIAATKSAINCYF